MPPESAFGSTVIYMTVKNVMSQIKRQIELGAKNMFLKYERQRVKILFYTVISDFKKT